MKGYVGQVEMGKTAKNQNDKIGFKCTHYSVTESSKLVRISIIKKAIDEIKVGVRTIDGTATNPQYYKKLNKIITMAQGQSEEIIEIEIIDNEEWGPDLDFYIELYDPNVSPDDTHHRLPGDDTRCTVTILDEDNPGTISFL